jgi:hypothetical protein
MGLKKRSLSLVGRGKPCIERYKKSVARRLRVRAPREERPRLFRARHGAGERVERNCQRTATSLKRHLSKAPQFATVQLLRPHLPQ